MLVLSRNVGERIRVGPDVVFTIVEVSGRKVRVGIDAPEGLRIERLGPDPKFVFDRRRRGRSVTPT
jgi:carbon storage regulator CsrA